MNFYKKVLPNGLRILTIPMPSFESATVVVMVGAGSRYETKLNNGISHFLEHMAFKGTEKRPSAMDISTLIDGMGGASNASTGKEITSYYIKSAADKIETSMDVLSDMLLHSKFDEKEIEKEKGVIIEELNMYEDTPTRKIGDIYERLVYGDTPLGWDIAGEKDIIRKIKRENFLSYLKSLYSADNIVVVVAGGIDTKKTNDLAQKYFGDIPKFDTLRYNKYSENQKKPGVFVKNKKTEQAHIALGFRTVQFNSPDRYPLEALSAILGGGMSSRLFHEVREKRGLAYYIGASSDLYTDTGSFVTWAGIDPKKVKDAISVILEEHRKVHPSTGSGSKFKVQSSELRKVKDFLKGHWVLNFENSMNVASYYGSWELLQKRIQTLDEALEQIEAVTIDQVEAAAGKYFVEEGLNLAVIGNFPSASSGQVASGQEFEKLLKL